MKQVLTVEIQWERNEKGQFVPKEVPGTEQVRPAQLVLLAMGIGGVLYSRRRISQPNRQAANFLLMQSLIPAMPIVEPSSQEGALKAFYWAGVSSGEFRTIVPTALLFPCGC